MRNKFDVDIILAVADVLDAFYNPRVYFAAKYIDPKTVVRASRPRFKGRLPAKNQNFGVVLTIGRPNFAQRLFIKKLKGLGGSLPLEEVQIKIQK